jgi:quercetin dioxygenase-like cupin family protein
VSKPQIDLQIVDNVFVKLHHFLQVGDTHDGHSHPFDHITLLAAGSVNMVHDNGEAVYKSPHLIVTPKGIKHQFTALEPNTVFCCIHAIREKDELDAVAEPNITEKQALELMHKYPIYNK